MYVGTLFRKKLIPLERPLPAGEIKLTIFFSTLAHLQPPCKYKTLRAHMDWGYGERVYPTTSPAFCALRRPKKKVGMRTPAGL